MKTILTFINEPNDSKEFIQNVARMATKLDANIHLLYVQNPEKYAYTTSAAAGTTVTRINQDLEKLAESAEKIFDQYISDLREKIPENVFIDYSTELGVPSVIINEYISAKKADMLVVEGQRDENFWTQTLSNIEIIRNVECPVWVFPASWTFKPYQEIIYATDYKEEDIKGLTKLIKITQVFSPVITALHVTDSVDFEQKVKKAGFLEMLKEKIGYDNLKVKMLNEKDDDIVTKLNDYANHINANLIVLLRENKSFFERLFTKDQTKKIVKKTNMPLLVFHSEK